MKYHGIQLTVTQVIEICFLGLEPKALNRRELLAVLSAIEVCADRPPMEVLTEAAGILREEGAISEELHRVFLAKHHANLAKRSIEGTARGHVYPRPGGDLEQTSTN